MNVDWWEGPSKVLTSSADCCQKVNKVEATFVRQLSYSPASYEIFESKVNELSF